MFLGPTILVDYYFYHKPVIPLLNIAKYNILGGSGGDSTLYGVEPWYFYIFNGFLNFNVVFFLALFSIPVCFPPINPTFMIF
jgi:alpha-1,2-mannosyltransferase